MCFGAQGHPKDPWRVASPDGCMCQVVSPDPGDAGRPMKKPSFLIANFDFRLMNVRCRDGLLSPLTRTGAAHGDLFSLDDGSEYADPPVMSAGYPMPAGTPIPAWKPMPAGMPIPAGKPMPVEKPMSAERPMPAAGQRSVVAAAAVAASAGQPINLRQGAAPSLVPAPGHSGGVETGIPLSAAERQQIAGRIFKLKEVAEVKWRRCARDKSFDEVLSPPQLIQVCGELG